MQDKCIALGMVLIAIAGLGFSISGAAYVISTDGDGNPTNGWDGPGLNPVTIDYYLGWGDAPDGNNGLSNTAGITLAQLESELNAAMATWSAVADITFNYLGNPTTNPGRATDPWGTPGNETIVVYFHDDGDGSAFPFDGPGLNSVFAHAWGPPDIETSTGGAGYQFAGNIHLDADELWTTGLADGTLYSSAGGVDLETILLHELGHSLGLAHVGSGFANPGGAIMEPFSNQALATLQEDDIAGICSLYACTDANGGGDDDPVPVPEPGSLSLLGAGLLGLGIIRKRRT